MAVRVLTLGHGPSQRLANAVGKGGVIQIS